MKKIFETERLMLREFTQKDAAFVLQLVNSPSWLKFIGDRNITTIEVATQYIKNNLMLSYEINYFGLWLVSLKDTGIPIGMCGLVNRDYLENIDIGFALLPKYERKGYMYEATKATMNYGKKVIGIDKIVAITDTKNVASIGLLNKIGLQFEKKLQLSDDDIILLFS
ncbi:GNAT family N-acetyltransferase [Kordia sp.]|uniref:GNAT family N-acetyltransferase n=1 Tax=Kordia sp. TaxID=1965332 RepID=UPI003D2D252F